MDSWLDYLRQGLSRKRSRDRLAGPEGLSGLKSKLRNLQPFLHRHWRRGALGILLIILTALLSLPQPLLFRYLVDHVLLGKQLVLLAGAILALPSPTDPLSASCKLPIAPFDQFPFFLSHCTSRTLKRET